MPCLSQPSVSVVIPTFNNVATLAEAVASVRDQHWDDLEIVVVDDGSTDETPRVLEALSGPDLRVIRQANAGPAAARNAGLQATRNEWIAFLDADDQWLPGKLLTQFNALEQHPDATFCFSDVLERTPDGNDQILRCRQPMRSVLLELLWGNLFSTPTLLVRRACFEEAGAFDISLRTGEDWDMWLRLAARYEGLFVCEPLVRVVRSAEPLKYKVETLDFCTRRVLQRLFSSPTILKDHPEIVGLRSRVYAWHYSVLAKSNFRNGRLGRAGFLAIASILSHPSGVRCLIPRREAGSGTYRPMEVEQFCLYPR